MRIGIGLFDEPVLAAACTDQCACTEGCVQQWSHATEQLLLLISSLFAAIACPPDPALDNSASYHVVEVGHFEGQQPNRLALECKFTKLSFGVLLFHSSLSFFATATSEAPQRHYARAHPRMRSSCAGANG